LSSSSSSSGTIAVVDAGVASETFLHLTPLVVGEWQQGERFATRGEQSFYWRTVFSAEGRRSRLDEAAARGLSAEVVGERDYLLSCLKELLFESVRGSVDPSLPSRSECMFLFESTLDPLGYGTRLGRDAADYTTLELRPVAGSRLFRARSALLDVPASVPEIVAAAEEYWRGLAADAPADDTEVLFTGRFEIIRVVSAGAGPRLTIEGKTFAELFGVRPAYPFAVNDRRTR
jgi:hypothetical protein